MRRAGSTPSKAHHSAARKAPIRQQRRKVANRRPVAARKAAVPSPLAFAPSRAARGIWDKPTDPKEQFVDFYHDTPKKNALEAVIHTLRDRYLIQTGNPQFFDRDHELRMALGPEQFEQHLKRARDADYGGFKGLDELAFHTSYYKRVALVPKAVGAETETLLLDQNLTFFRQIPGHLLMPHNLYQQQYLDFRTHEGKHTGVASSGPYYVARTDFEFPQISVDADYLFFHD